MPIIKSAIKRMRQDRKRTLRNKTTKSTLKKALNAAKKTKSVADLAKAYSVIDKTAKKKVIHKNKAARLKSKLAKLAATPKKQSKSK
jgi:small subunit ribosomal protein S20